MVQRQETSGNRLDDAARAGWLYYVAGNNQEQIAQTLGVSRQTAQRLVSLSISEGLIRVRLDHPIGRCMELGEKLRQRYALDFVEIVPTDPTAPDSINGVAIATAGQIERWLKHDEPVIMALGTGRTLKAAIEQMSPIDASQHKIVSLTGSIAPDGAAAYYNVIFDIAQTVKARSFPMPLPVIASSSRERELLHAQPMIQETLTLARQANVTFVGIGEIDPDAPLYVDGFITSDELRSLQKAGAVGEICGWSFDADGKLIEGLTNDRVASAPVPSRETSLVVAIAAGNKKLPGLRASLSRRLVNGLITDERTAENLLNTP
ncbi:sugar-binding transcriptional regulator [Devosia rhodophyticola]|uniref:Sugar-binding transcriptional regulator n=1 Tax=Devosia rhodophyticola TaxID=3026423 RepID=A0ABY7Z1R8_9HYPH|nr:sugar-binding transcriptional regulator [Devosia rhodophyticola]WDR06930.1 sugar-binding transcriptional regulator [Devosia rhodophyticola]